MKKGIKNKKLHILFEQFSNFAISLLIDKTKQGQVIPYKIKTTVVKTGPTSHSFPQETKPDFSSHIDKYKEEIRKSEEFTNLAEYLLSIDEIKKYNQCWFRKDFPIDFLSALLRITGKLTFDSKEFRRLYASFEEDLYAKRVNFQLVAPLKNFNSTSSEIELEEGLVIRLLEDNELNRLWKLGVSNFGNPFFQDLLSCPFMLILNTKVEKREGFDFSKDIGVLKKVVTALRIFKRGLVGYSFVSDLPPASRPIREIYEDTNYYFNTFYKPYLGTKYEISKEEGKKLIRFWNRFNNSNTKHIQVAIDRFSQASEREKTEDKIIDNIVGFENIYLNDGEGEFKFKLGTRASAVLGKNDNERLTIFSFLKNAYDIRSKIVHGRSDKEIQNKLKKLNFSKLSDFNNTLEEYLRKSIKIYINNPAIFDLETLNQRILFKDKK